MGILLVTRNNFKRSLNHKGRFIVSILLPVIICILVGMFNYNESTILRVGFKTESSNQIAKDWFLKLQQMERIKIDYVNPNTYHTDVIMGKYQLLMDCQGVNNVKDIHWMTTKDDEWKAQYSTIISSILLTNNKEAYTNFMNIKKVDIYTLDTTERTIALLMTIFMIMATLNGAMILKDKNTGTFLRYQYSPSKKINYITGNSFYVFLITFLQVTIALIFMVLTQNNRNFSVGDTFIVSTMVTLICTGYAMLLCKTCKNDVQANITASSLAAILSILGGTFIPISYMPTVFQFISKFSPIRWMIEFTNILTK